MIHIPVSIGELIDKITILEIKSEEISDETKLVHVNYELSLLNSCISTHPWDTEDEKIFEELKEVNKQLWAVEDKLRYFEEWKSFNGNFTTAARSVYKLNDQRAELKRRLNIKYNSEIIEEKEY